VRTLFLLLGLVLSVSACTTRNWYEGLRLGQQQQCDKLPASQASDCHRQLAPDYDQYQKQKQGVSKPAQ
jgi:hypothetical protein